MAKLLRHFIMSFLDVLVGKSMVLSTVPKEGTLDKYVLNRVSEEGKGKEEERGKERTRERKIG